MNKLKKAISFKSVIIITLILFSSCISKEKHEPLRIAISKAGPGDHYNAYSQWLKIADTTLLTYDLYSLSIDSSLKLLEECDGLLLTGGPDINPGLYGKKYDTTLVDISDFKRDSLELLLIKKALKLELPLLGICRGLQMINISQGGTLIRDIPTEFNSKIYHRCSDKSNCYHQIFIKKNSQLYKTVNNDLGIVNTNHHQGIDILAGNLSAVAYSEDSLIEAIELSDNKSFLLGVQWHPERMDIKNPLSVPIALLFIKQAEIYQKNLSKQSHTK